MQKIIEEVSIASYADLIWLVTSDNPPHEGRSWRAKERLRRALRYTRQPHPLDIGYTAN